MTLEELVKQVDREIQKVHSNYFESISFVSSEQTGDNSTVCYEASRHGGAVKLAIKYLQGIYNYVIFDVLYRDNSFWNGRELGETNIPVQGIESLSRYINAICSDAENNVSEVQEGRFDDNGDVFIAVTVDNLLDAENLFLQEQMQQFRQQGQKTTPGFEGPSRPGLSSHY
jgi:hypothetical protein